MRVNPQGWRIEDLKAIADRWGIDHRQPGTSHVTFSFPGVASLTVPSQKPIKAVYIRQFLAMLDGIAEVEDGSRR